MKHFLIALSVFTTLVLAAPEYLTCFQCADKKTFRFCDQGGYVKNAWTGACCAEDDTSPECTPSDKNKCSDTFENA